MSISAEKQLANQRNAQLSTGPTSTEGKARASRNATRHGLFSTQLLLPGEDPAALATLREGLLRRLQPRDVLETQIVEQYIECSWKLLRLRKAEKEAYLDEMTVMKQQLLDLAAGTEFGAPRLSELPEPDSGLVMWRMLRGGKDAPLERLGRHEQRLRNTMQRCLRDLEKLQQQEIDAAVPNDVEHATKAQNEPTAGADQANHCDEKGLYRAAWDDQRAAEARAEDAEVSHRSAEAPPSPKSAA